jgi:addiction module HigA family antidote
LKEDYSMSDAELPVTRPIAREPTHPGELMREILDEHVRMPIADAVRRMQVWRPALYAVLNGTGAVTPQMALRFGRLVNAAPKLYVQMQMRRDPWPAEQRLKDQLAKIEPAV